MASESSPLLAYRLLGEEGVALPANGAGGPGGASARKLSTFLGVVVPTVLSMFSIVVFLRIAGYAEDYTTGAVMNFASVFAVLFNGCTGIMAGANMSGELKDPSRAIPLGTIVAVAYTFFVYVLLFFLSSFTCDRTLLQEDYGFFRAISLWPPLVLIGIYATALSASMSSLIGASRILHALARDDLFGVILAPAKVVSRGGNPWAAVLYSWGLVQLVLLAGKLNTLAAVVTVFYLVAYAAVDLSCL
ncbi:solute carrier family 12 member 9, partial [Homo sapiens]